MPRSFWQVASIQNFGTIYINIAKLSSNCLFYREKLGVYNNPEHASSFLAGNLRQLTFVANLSSNFLFYREKLAYITTVNMQVPVLPSESKEDVSQVEDLLQDGRMGHEV